MYIRDPKKVKWIQNHINVNGNHPNFSKDEKLKILDSLNKAYTFENFLQKKYVGQKRFSLEGGESLIPAIDFLINIAADKGVEDVVMGMSHRGRLNTLVNIFGKSSKDIFGEFDGKDQYLFHLQLYSHVLKYYLLQILIRNHNSHLHNMGVIQSLSKKTLENFFLIQAYCDCVLN